jgi:hypothetical protein
LEELVWDWRYDRPVPARPDLEWQLEDPEPIEVIAGEDLELEIFLSNYPNPNDIKAVLVAYEVMTESGGVVGHFINEAVLEAQSPQAIVEIMVNFDIHNATGLDVTNFELDFLGLDFGCDDVRGAVGFIAAEGIPPVPVIPPVIWGANEENPLVVRPIPGGTEVKWIQPDRPLKDCEWLHVGLVFDCTAFDCFNDDPLGATVQGYWTITEPCEEPMDCFEVNFMGAADRKWNYDIIKGNGSLKLGAGALPFDSDNDAVTFAINGREITIPAGSFVERYIYGFKVYCFHGLIPDVAFVRMYLCFEKCLWQTTIYVRDASDVVGTDPTTVGLTIGENFGTDSFNWTRKWQQWTTKLAKFIEWPPIRCCAICGN